jgi:hypothetical protein
VLFSHNDVVEASGVLRRDAVSIGKHIPLCRNVLLASSSRWSTLKASYSERLERTNPHGVMSPVTGICFYMF